MRNKPFSVHGIHITESVSKKMSSHATREEAEAEAARKSNLKVYFWDGPRPLYSEVHVQPVEEEITWDTLLGNVQITP